MKITVIISTYNNPKWLEKAIWGYMSQSRMADEIIVADDGSDIDTKNLIEHYRHFLPLKHVWQEDDGFRKTEILNKAIKASTGDYLIFTDQDCVPRADFIATHQHCAQKGYFLSGGYFKLPMNISEALTQTDVAGGRAFSLAWLFSKGLKKSFKCTKLLQLPAFAKFMNFITPTKPTWNGMNSSGWREDIVAAKGFDERMKYGGEDRELGERLFNAGIRSKQIRYSAIVVHLDHNRPYVNAADRALNDAIRKHTREAKLTQTDHGL